MLKTTKLSVAVVAWLLASASVSVILGSAMLAAVSVFMLMIAMHYREVLDHRSTQEELATTSKELEGRNRRDSLTGLYRKGILDERLAEVFSEKDFTASLIMIDIDHFKQVNDTYGHEIGNEVLKSVAIAMQSTLRKGDTLVRYGGEEFVVLVEGAPPIRTLEIANRLRETLEGLSFREIPQLCVTASFGVCSIDGHKHKTSTEAIRCADANMYKAKKAGRNKVVS